MSLFKYLQKDSQRYTVSVKHEQDVRNKQKSFQKVKYAWQRLEYKRKSVKEKNTERTNTGDPKSNLTALKKQRKGKGVKFLKTENFLELKSQNWEYQEE